MMYAYIHVERKKERLEKISYIIIHVYIYIYVCVVCTYAYVNVMFIYVCSMRDVET